MMCSLTQTSAKPSASARMAWRRIRAGVACSPAWGRWMPSFMRVPFRGEEGACAEPGADGNGAFRVERNDCIWRAPRRMGGRDERARSDADATEHADADRAI